MNYQHYINLVRGRWNQLAQREQRLVGATAAFLVIVLFWLLIWQPLTASIERAEQGLIAQQQQFSWVQERINQIESVREAGEQRAQQISADQLPGLLNQLSTEHNLSITRIQSAQNGYQLVFEEASFEQLLGFLVQLSERGVVIEQFDVAETNTTGVVRVRRLQVSA